jgi:hypothetical protein
MAEVGESETPRSAKTRAAASRIARRLSSLLGLANPNFLSL